MNELDAYNEWRASQSLPPLAPKPVQKRPHLLNLSDTAWDGLQKLALSKGYAYFAGGNVTAFLEALGAQLLNLEAPTAKQ